MTMLTRRRLIAAACAAPFAASAPALFAQDADKLPAVFLIGDSITRNDYNDNGGTNLQWGWGRMLRWRFDTTRIHVVNDAMGGTSSRSYMENPELWPKVKQMIRPGDYVLIGFGHNDGPSVGRGNGDETTFIAGPAPRGPRPAPAGTAPAVGATPAAPATPPPPRPQIEVHSFGWYIREYIRQIRELGATPVVLSLIPRNRWTDGKIGAGGSEFATWAEEAAVQAKAPFIPLNTLVSDRFNQIGEAKVTADYFPPREAVHPNWAGAVLISGLVVDGIRKLDIPLKQYLVASPNVPAVPDIAPPTLGDLGPKEMKPTSRTPKPVA